MTANQINFANLQETKRHNLVTEAETQRHQQAMESLQSEQNAINSQHYARQDAYNSLHYATMDAETARHNLAGESISTQQLSLDTEKQREVERHNVTTEKISKQELKEKKRSNKASESIKSREAEASIMNAYTNRENAETNAVNAQTRIAELGETTRHNKMTEDVQVWNARIADERLDNDWYLGLRQQELAEEKFGYERDKIMAETTNISSKTKLQEYQVLETKAKTNQLSAQAKYIQREYKWYPVSTALDATKTLLGRGGLTNWLVPLITE